MSAEIVKNDPAFALQRRPENAVAEYIPFGSSEKIKLTVKIVQELIATPTKSGKTCSERDAMRFMMLCRSRALNPFEGDCFLLGYDTQDGPAFSLITAHQAFLKRAEPHPEFDGMESGVIISPALACPMCRAEGGREVNGAWVVCSACKGIGQTDEIEGDIVPPEHNLIGGWAKVHFKNRRVPMKKRLSLKTFSTGRSRWGVDPAGMIVKCAEADALRSSFPTKLGGLYLQEEQPEMKVARVETPTDLESSVQKLIASEPTEEPRDRVSTTTTVEEKPKREQKAKDTNKPAPPRGNARDALLARMVLEQVTESEVIEILVRKNKTTGASSLLEIPDDVIAWALEMADVIFGQIRIDRKNNTQPN